MKKEATLFNIDSFDIFGNIKNDRTKISVHANKRHRESEKDKYKILDVSDNLTLEEYKDKIKKEINIIEKILDNTKAITDIDIYFCSNDKLD